MKLQVGVKALIKNNDDKYLFVRRSQILQNEQEPYWDIPGGRIEVDEPLLVALRREIAEETGLHIDKTTPRLLMAQDIFVTKAELHVVRLTYMLDGDGDAIMSDEHTESQWLTLDEVWALNLDPFLKEALEYKKLNSI
jgi:8-oxo-dGTP diphosphatase